MTVNGRMAKFSFTDINTSLQPMFDSDKIMVKQLRKRKTIPGCSVIYKNSSYNVWNKRKKNGVSITKKARLLNDISGHQHAMKGEITPIMNPIAIAKYMVSLLSQRAYRPSSYAISSPITCLPFFLFVRCMLHLRFIIVHLWLLLYASIINTSAYVIVVMIATKALFFFKLLQVPKMWRWIYYNISTIKYPIQMYNTTSAAPNQKWMLIDKDVLFAVDVYSIENFCISLGILLAWRLFCRLLFYVFRRFYSKNDRK